MKALVTGATTPLGRALVEQLVSSHDCALVLAVGHEPKPDPPWRADVPYRSIDLTRRRDVHDLIRGEAAERRIDTVVHMAQHRATHDSGRNVHAQNVTATRELMLRCADHPTIRRFVYRSFAEVYALEHATSDLLDEEAALDFDPTAPQWLRDRVEADLTVCAHFGGALQIAVRLAACSGTCRAIPRNGPGRGGDCWWSDSRTARATHRSGPPRPGPSPRSRGSSHWLQRSRG